MQISLVLDFFEIQPKEKQLLMITSKKICE